jgi:uncharacterized RDD family membrane protein YckC
VERIGISRRLPAAVLDWFILLVLTGIGITIYSAVGGARLGLEAQRAMGIAVTPDSVFSGAAWEEYGRRSEQMVAEIERMVRDDFTAAERNAMGEILEDHWEGKLPVDGRITRDNVPIDFLFGLNADSLNDAVDESFDAIIADPTANIPAGKANALRAEVKKVLADFGVATVLPRVIQFVVWLFFLPTVITLGYGLIEGLFGRSPGKFITGIVIRRDGGERAYSSTLLLRYTIKNASLLLMVLALLLRSPAVAMVSGAAGFVVFIGMLVMIGPERRAIYDFVAGTAVYRSNAVSDED